MQTITRITNHVDGTQTIWSFNKECLKELPDNELADVTAKMKTLLDTERSLFMGIGKPGKIGMELIDSDLINAIVILDGEKERREEREKYDVVGYKNRNFRYNSEKQVIELLNIENGKIEVIDAIGCSWENWRIEPFEKLARYCEALDEELQYLKSDLEREFGKGIQPVSACMNCRYDNNTNTCYHNRYVKDRETSVCMQYQPKE